MMLGKVIDTCFEIVLYFDNSGRKASDTAVLGYSVYFALYT